VGPLHGRKGIHVEQKRLHKEKGGVQKKGKTSEAKRVLRKQKK